MFVSVAHVSKTLKLNPRQAALGWIAFRALFLGVMALTTWILAKSHGSSGSPVSSQMVLWGFGFSVLCAGILAMARSHSLAKILLWTQLVWDLSLTTILITETGGLTSGFVLVYCLFILLATIFMRTEGAIASAVLACAMFMAIGLKSHGPALLTDVPLAMRCLFVISAIIFAGGTMASFARHRQRLSESLERTKHELDDLSSIYSEIIEHSPSGILVANKRSDRIEFVNPTGVRISGRSWRGETLSRSPWSLLTESRERIESEIDLPSGRKVIGYHCTDLPGEMILVVFQDLSEVRRLEGQLRLNEKLASVGQLAAGIAHEIRNPLASLSGSIQLMQSELPQDSTHRKLIAIVLRETDRLDGLIRNFLDYAKPSALRLEKVDVLAVITEVITLLRQRNAIQTRFEVTGETGLAIVCDLSSLKQILWNLLLNAVDAMQGGGCVRLEVLRHRDGLRLTVSDEGPGISADVQSRIFDPFFTTKKEGTGLGLALVYQMVGAHGGKVGVDASQQGGAKFWVELPLQGPNKDEQKVA